jgi:hypothetical protein
MPKVDRLFSLLLAIFDPLLDALRFIRLGLQQRCTLAENLFLRKQLALYLERQVEPRRPRAAAKLTLVLLSRLFPWRQALTIVKPDTFVRWHRQGFRLFWKWKSRPRGRPRIPTELQKLIVGMASDNPAWGEERIAAELLLKVGIRISPRHPKYNPARQAGCWNSIRFHSEDKRSQTICHSRQYPVSEHRPTISDEFSSRFERKLKSRAEKARRNRHETTRIRAKRFAHE